MSNVVTPSGPLASSAKWLRANAKPVAWLALLLGLAVGRPGAIFLADVLLILTALVYLVRLLTALVRRRREAVMHAVLWLLVCAVIFWASRVATHVYRVQSRTAGDALVAQVLAWRSANDGQWPADYATVTGAPRGRVGMLPHYGRGSDGQPYLFYRDAWSGFETWSYDFETRGWTFRRD